MEINDEKSPDTVSVKIFSTFVVNKDVTVVTALLLGIVVCGLFLAIQKLIMDGFVS